MKASEEWRYSSSHYSLGDKLRSVVNFGSMLPLKMRMGVTRFGRTLWRREIHISLMLEIERRFLSSPARCLVTEITELH